MLKLHVIWDLDGTLINSEREVLDALVRSVCEAGFSENDQKKPFRVGPTVDKMIDNAFGEGCLEKGKKQEIITAFRKNYDNCGFNNTPAFDGIEEILSDKHFVHHIVTNKPDFATNRIIKKLGWEKYFASVVTPYSFMKSPADERKSKTELFALCMKDFPNEHFVGIGDMDTDAKAAIENNIPAIGVLWGTGTRSELETCDISQIVDSVDKLHEVLLDYEK